MKKQPLLFGLIGFAFLLSCIIWACTPPQAFVTVRSIAGGYGEDYLDLHDNPMTRTEGHIEMDSCYKYLLFDSIYHMQRHLDTVVYKDFTALRDIAQKLVPGSYRHVLGLKIMFGYDSIANKLCLLYLPQYLQDTSTSNSNANVPYVTGGTPNVYIHSSNGFVTTTKAGALTRAYQRHFTYKDPGDKYFKRFYDKMDINGSVKGVIFPFQEIDSVVLAQGDTEIIFCNAAEVIKVQAQGSYHYLTKHVLLLGCESINAQLAAATKNKKEKVNANAARAVDPSIFYGHFGNLAHLCPPNCDFHRYNIK